MRPRVTGIGGVFFKSRDPAALADWYRTALGVDVAEWGGAQFFWNHGDGARDSESAYTVWNPFSEDTKYFDPSEKPFMLNFRVNDLDALLDALKAAGANVLTRREDTEQGRFGYVLDPEGTLLELWQPSEGDPSAPR